MSGYPKATCQHECPQAVAADARADRWQARHDALAARLAAAEEALGRVKVLADEWETVAAVARKDITLSRAAARLRFALASPHVSSGPREAQAEEE